MEIEVIIIHSFAFLCMKFIERIHFYEKNGLNASDLGESLKPTLLNINYSSSGSTIFSIASASLKSKSVTPPSLCVDNDMVNKL